MEMYEQKYFVRSKANVFSNDISTYRMQHRILDSTLEANNVGMNSVTDKLCTPLKSYKIQLSDYVSSLSRSKAIVM